MTSSPPLSLASDRRRAMLRTAMGEDIAALLADPLTQEIRHT